jgi:hypothetical protein
VSLRLAFDDDVPVGGIVHKHIQLSNSDLKEAVAA